MRLLLEIFKMIFGIFKLLYSIYIDFENFIIKKYIRNSPILTFILLFSFLIGLFFGSYL
jgi:hypothetical protein